MLSRRIIRIKVMQALYAHYNVEGSSILTSEKQLFHSIQKSYDLYILFFALIVDIKNYSLKRMELAKQKRIPSEEDLNPNTRFIDNLVIKQIEENAQLLKLWETKKLNWVNHPELIKCIFHAITESELYQEYIHSADEPDYYSDKKFIIAIYKEIISVEENLYQTLEEQSIYWNDEGEFVISMLCKTINGFKQHQGPNATILNVFKNDDDEQYTRQLLRKAIVNGSEYKELLKKFTRNWEIERIAFLDILLIQLALTEILEFQFIPIKVSMNEYIEIAKFYSTEKSNVFLNGVLDQIVSHLKVENKIKKLGRGLVGESD
jgi:transcription antitermination protein NusB